MPIGGSGTLRIYRVDWVPQGCKLYRKGDELRVEVLDPPPSSLTLNYGGVCDGIIATLVP